MLRHFLAHIPRPGARPGDLSADTPPPRELPLSVHRVDYGDGTAPVQTRHDDPGDALTAPRRTGGLCWLHFQGEPGPELLARVRETFDLHPLAVEDVLHLGQRPKLEPFDDQVFAILTRPVRDDDGLRFEQISLFVGDGYLLSFHAGTEDIFAPVRQRIMEGKGRIARADPDYLGYCLADVVVDHGFPVLESYADDLEAIEEDIFADRHADPVPAIHAVRRDLIGMRKMQWRLITMVTDWLRAEHPLLSEENVPYFRDAEDHAQRVGDLLESYLDTTGSLLDAHLSLSSARLNDVMKMLTLIATIFMPLTFIAGIYGMNFDPAASPWNMPELSHRYGYPLALLSMVVMGVAMYLYFRFRRWL
ncbi:magnesium and cobalt transporter CorA [Salinisphaera sp. PC39]|uniref:magnesium/cobalt transporter CorA n=1 Tax=Salinisphaera sp. PC39 TaxID=1304156 RepID=UPI00334049E9